MFARRMLVPVDLTPRSAQALAYACELASAIGAEVDALHVVPGPGKLHAAVDAYAGLPMPHASESAVAEARAALKDFVDGIALHGVTPRLLVDSGDAAAVIVRTAVETPNDLIVMATRGHRGVAEVLLGSVAHKVITCAPCPVLTLGGPRWAS